MTFISKKNSGYYFSSLLVLLLFYICGTSSKIAAQHKIFTNSPMFQLEAGFMCIPDTIQTSVYWYWVSDNISKQGVINDLEAMKKVGINRAFIGNIGRKDVPYGKVKLFSAEWWDIMHTALKTATRLGIEIGIFNCPGWSQSGGPWVKPEQSMRYLTSSEVLVKGPLLFSKKLAQPNDKFQDVKVIAYPAPKDYNQVLGNTDIQLYSVPQLKNVQQLFDHDENTIVDLPTVKSTIGLEIARDFTIRSIQVYPAKRPAYFEADIQVKVGQEYRTIKHFIVDRTNNDLNVGFTPYGPITIAIPPTATKNLRLVFSNIAEKSGIAEIKLSGAAVLENYLEKTLAKMWQTPYPYWSAYHWAAQPIINDQAYVIDPSKVLDISNKLSPDGVLYWKIPKGQWIIERCGMTPTLVQNSPASPEGKGLETDKMSKKHIAAHFEAFLGEIQRRISAEDRKTWKIAVQDSYESGSQNWTDDLLEKFRLSYGYDPLPYLPVLQGKVVGSADQSDRFLWDLRRFIADNVAYEYVGGLREICHKNGLTTWLENYGHWGFPGEFLQYGGQSDEVSGEFWSEGDLGAIENRAAASCAHIYGKTKVSAESFTAGGPAYSRYPAMMKQRADRFFAEGINNSLLHLYIQQPNEDRLPGINAWFGNEFNRHNTWYYDMDLFVKYIKRCNLMLQQGKYVAEAAYFISEDAPKMTGAQDPTLPSGYSFDYINAEVIKTRMTVKNGRLFLPDGMNYRILVLPKLFTIRPELLRKIKELVYQGAVVLGPRPSASPSLTNYGKADQEVKQLSAEMWGNIDGKNQKVNHYGKGLVIDGMNLESAFKLIDVLPDFKTNPNDSLLFIHRELNDGSIYFISNQKNKTIAFNPQFRITGKAAELWDATTGSIRDLKAYSMDSLTTTIPMQLEPFESAFVIFRKAAINKVVKGSNYLKTIKTLVINGNWEVTFDPKMRGPLKPVIFKQLADWTEIRNDSIKYYSGTAWYRKVIRIRKVRKHEKIMLDLGLVTAIAKVTVNGKELGGLWTAPYRIDITSALKAGSNKLEIKVVNTWVNRLIGDSKLSPDERKTWMNDNRYTPESNLKPSGLKGPVKLEIMN